MSATLNGMNLVHNTLLGMALGLAALVPSGCDLDPTNGPPDGPVAPETTPPLAGNAEGTIAISDSPPKEPAPMPDEHAQDGAAPVAVSESAQPTHKDAQAAESSDEQITEQIRQHIRSDLWLSPSARMMRISTYDGIVTLRGVVESEDERLVVKHIVREVEGVREIIDEIEVPGD